MAKNHGQEQAKVLTSDEMNYLIYRYLQECGECSMMQGACSGSQLIMHGSALRGMSCNCSHVAALAAAEPHAWH